VNEAMVINPEICGDAQQALFMDLQELDNSSLFDPWHLIKTDRDINDIPKTKTNLENRLHFQIDQETLCLGFNSQPKPWLSPILRLKLDKINKGKLKPEELVDLIEDLAKICADFYKVETGKVIAVRFDGRIVESADSEIDLLLKIQGRKFGVPIFVWQVGTESFSGWRI